ncbi:DegT/DnrJ/EryC1/StrS family aminotransferase, partial [Candidatus Woesearchaeota archaeon]|nr:DegT/DnrJ/EryC1/StrS family aminotransferase [Candidatus Woesearchaeota archaeon]
MRKFIPVAEPVLEGNELKYVTECVKTGWISSAGKFVKKFEEKFSKYCDCKYGVAVSNGTTALHLALVALGIKKGDEVIVPNFTFVATANAVVYVGGVPVFVDADKETWNIDVDKIEEKITSKTKAIIPVNIYGHPCDMNKIMDIAKKHNLYVIEDCAESHGAEYNGEKTGSFGDISCFSFYGNKIITTGEGGMCVTNNKELAEKMSMLKDHGMKPERRYWHETIGFNYRMTNIQAAIGLAQLENINKFIETKRENTIIYNSL